MEHILRTGAAHQQSQERTPSRRELNKQIQRRLYVLFIGLFGGLLAESAYPLVDRGAVSVLRGLLFLLPFVVHITLAVRKRLAANIDRLRRVYSSCGAVLLGVAAVLGLNGLLDRAPSRSVRTSIIHKHVTTPAKGGGITHVLDVSSWRPGRDEEHLLVSSSEYWGTAIGNLVVIEVHPGRFGLSWYRLNTP